VVELEDHGEEEKTGREKKFERETRRCDQTDNDVLWGGEKQNHIPRKGLRWASERWVGRGLRMGWGKHNYEWEEVRNRAHALGRSTKGP